MCFLPLNLAKKKTQLKKCKLFYNNNNQMIKYENLFNSINELKQELLKTNKPCRMLKKTSQNY